MSLANRATTKAEEAILEAGGFRQSALESMGDFNGEGLYQGNWFHDELPQGVCHLGPDEALEFLAQRRAALQGIKYEG